MCSCRNQHVLSVSVCFKSVGLSPSNSPSFQSDSVLFGLRSTLKSKTLLLGGGGGVGGQILSSKMRREVKKK